MESDVVCGEELILASKSKGREMILRAAGFGFKVMPSTVDESKINCKNPEELVKKLAFAKAEEVASKVSESCIVIGADTVCLFEGKIIGKPKTKDDAARMLESFSAKTHEVITGIAVICRKNKTALADISKAKVAFRKLLREEIEDYLKSGDAYRFAGAYNIEGTKSMAFIESISGSYSSIIGMPFEKLIPMLRECRQERAKPGKAAAAKKAIMILKSVHGLGSGYAILSESGKKAIAQMPERRNAEGKAVINLGVKEALSRDITIVFSHNEKFRPPPSAIVLLSHKGVIVGELSDSGKRFYNGFHGGGISDNDAYLLPPVPFPELEAADSGRWFADVCSASPGYEADMFLRQIIKAEKNDATLLVGFNIKHTHF